MLYNGIRKRLIEAVNGGVSKALDGDDMFDNNDDMNPIVPDIEDSSMYVNHGKEYHRIMEFARRCSPFNEIPHGLDDAAFAQAARCRRLSREDAEYLDYLVANVKKLSRDVQEVYDEYQIRRLFDMHVIARVVRMSLAYRIKKSMALDDISQKFISEISRCIDSKDSMFYGIVPLDQKKHVQWLLRHYVKPDGNLNWLDVSQMKYFENMFYDNKDFNGDISLWDVSHAEQMQEMFSCSVFNGDISKWDVRNVKDMSYMFSDSCFNGNISDWKINLDRCETFNMFYGTRISRVMIPKVLLGIADDVYGAYGTSRGLDEGYHLNAIDGDEMFDADDTVFEPTANDMEDSSVYVNVPCPKGYGKLMGVARDCHDRGIVLSLICNDGNEYVISDDSEHVRKFATVRFDGNVRFIRFGTQDMLRDGEDDSIVISVNWKDHYDYGYTWQCTDQDLTDCVHTAEEAECDFGGYGNTAKAIERARLFGKSLKSYIPAMAYAWKVKEKLKGWNVQGYLPAMGQLKFMHDNLDLINEALGLFDVGHVELKGSSWWSSSESHYRDAWMLDSRGQVDDYPKTSGGDVFVIFHLQKTAKGMVKESVSRAIDGDDMFDADGTDMNPIDADVEDSSTYSNHSKKCMEVKAFLDKGYPIMDLRAMAKILDRHGEDYELLCQWCSEIQELSDLSFIGLLYNSMLKKGEDAHGMMKKLFSDGSRCRFDHEAGNLMTDRGLWYLIFNLEIICIYHDMDCFVQDLLEKRNPYNRSPRFCSDYMNVTSKDDLLYAYYKPKDNNEFRQLVGLSSGGSNLNWIDTSEITDMSKLFSVQIYKGGYDISLWDVSKVRNMSSMFENNECQWEEDFSQWDISHVTNMRKMFKGSMFSGNISNWNVCNVLTMSEMFRQSAFDGDLSSWVINPKCKVDGMFMNSAVPDNKKPKRVRKQVSESVDYNRVINDDELFDDGLSDFGDFGVDDTSVYANHGKLYQDVQRLIAEGWNRHRGSNADLDALKQNLTQHDIEVLTLLSHDVNALPQDVRELAVSNGVAEAFVSVLECDQNDAFKCGYAETRLLIDGLVNKSNFIDSEGRLLSLQWFRYCCDFSEGYAVVCLGDKHNYIDVNGDLLCDEWFDECFAFHGGFGIVTLDGKMNFMNERCEYLSDEWFDECDSFSAGWAVVTLNGKCNYINRHGDYLFSEWVDEARPFRRCGGGLAAFVKNGKCNFVDTEGHLLSGMWFDYVNDFNVVDHIAVVTLNGKRNYIDTRARILSDVWFDSIVEYYSSVTKCAKVMVDGYVRYMYKDGSLHVRRPS